MIVRQIYNVCLGQFLAAVAPTKAVSSALGPGLSTLFTLTAGFMIQPDQIPNYWKWLYWISPNHYALEGLSANELSGSTCGSISGDMLLEEMDMDFDNRWRNWGIILMYVVLLRLGTLYALKNIEHVKR